MKKTLWITLVVFLLLSLTQSVFAASYKIPSGTQGISLSTGVLYEGNDSDYNVLSFKFEPVVKDSYCVVLTAPNARTTFSGGYLFLAVYDQNGECLDIKYDYTDKIGPKKTQWLILEKGITYSIRIWCGSSVKEGEKSKTQYYYLNEYALTICSASTHADIADYILQRNVSCEQEGISTAVCNRCGEIAGTKLIPATGHTPGAWQTAKQATCSEEGNEFKRCSTCQAIVETRIIEKLDHTPASEWTTVMEPTCITNGYKSHLCTVCGAATDRFELLAQGHTEDPAGYQINEQPGCDTLGKKALFCTTCGSIIDWGTMPATGHTYDEWIVTREATPEHTGIRARSCLLCGSSQQESIVYAESCWTCACCGNDKAYGNYCYNCGAASEADWAVDLSWLYN